MHIRHLPWIISMPLAWSVAYASTVKANSPESQDFSQQWWMPKQVRLKQKDSAVSQPAPPASRGDSEPSQTFAPTPQIHTQESKDKSNDQPFVVPAYFASQPEAYVRPTETFRAPMGGFGNFGPGIIGSPFGGNWGGGLLSGFGGLSAYRFGFGSPWSAGGMGLSGLGSGLGWRGFNRGWGGGWGGGWSGWGFGGMGPGTLGGLGSLRSTGVFSSAVIQSAPSKASGNYYAASTVDPTASGSYYATGAPALTPAIRVKTSPDSYWDDSSNPVPKNLR